LLRQHRYRPLRAEPKGQGSPERNFRPPFDTSLTMDSSEIKKMELLSIFRLPNDYRTKER
jgi:hypothetical protein